ncbi:MAG: DUF4113 domain-containing protein [Sphaerochaeta sp.]|nr:DUF4113 domain-containing protein [Sphaerochaeta sp.]
MSGRTGWYAPPTGSWNWTKRTRISSGTKSGIGCRRPSRKSTRDTAGCPWCRGPPDCKAKQALMQQGRLSPRYTTDITQLPVANANRIAKLFSSDG